MRTDSTERCIASFVDHGTSSDSLSFDVLALLLPEWLEWPDTRPIPECNDLFRARPQRKNAVAVFCVAELPDELGDGGGG